MDTEKIFPNISDIKRTKLVQPWESGLSHHMQTFLHPSRPSLWALLLYHKPTTTYINAACNLCIQQHLLTVTLGHQTNNLKQKKPKSGTNMMLGRISQPLLSAEPLW